MELKCGAVILAGGRGSRFGGVNKAELSYLGKSFCGRIREEFDRLGMDCFFSAGAYPPPEEPGLKVIPDLPVEGEEGPIGPMGGILSCFEQTRCDLLFLCPATCRCFTGGWRRGCWSCGRRGRTPWYGGPEAEGFSRFAGCTPAPACRR